jgi:hypothetical protein
MSSKILSCLIAGALATSVALAPPALAWGDVGGGRFVGAPFARAGFAPRFSRVAFHDGFHHRFVHHRFHRFAFFGVPYAYAAYDGCWRRVWTSYGPQWVNVCGDYGYY